MLLQFLDYLGVAVFAVSGGIVASRKGLDFTAFLFFSAFTGLGGGTLRDLILDAPVFWINSNGYMIVCLLVAILTWFFAHRLESFGRPLSWADAIGIAAYSVMGAAKTLSLGHTGSVAVLMGVATATFGGVVRDVIAGEPSALVKSEIYLTATFAGAGLYVFLVSFAGLSIWLATILGATVALILRGGAIERNWTLPIYRR